MKSFQYKNNILFADDVSLVDIAAQYGTPCYVYSRSAIESNWHAFHDAFGSYPHRICYAVKANSNIAVLQVLAQLGSGFDIVSQGELERVLKAGGDPQKVVFSGVGKTEAEIIRALDANILCFNIESIAELERVHLIAKNKDVIATVSLRLNPNIDARTHPYIATGLLDNKFGIDIKEAAALCRKIKLSMPHINLIGLACHIGSQLTELEPFLEAITCLLDLVEQLYAEQIQFQYIDFGGGLGVCYQNESPPAIQDYVYALVNKVEKFKLKIILEPGRAIIANAGILLTRVEYLKHTPHKNFAIVDAGMNDLIRPALYDSWQNIIPVTPHHDTTTQDYDVVGPVCESSDFIGKHRKLALLTGDLLAVCSTGAYGFSMSSNYNSRPRVPEIMVTGNKTHVIRKRETINDLFELENLIN